ncbi:hypothetical protein CEK26_004640 [Fusarium fujikuroi]|uniref:Uncharacterized protein n=1 Tax=Fusarium fujikuroi TaxID=5127 RepID=A0A5Q3EF99_FUSFU|nr:hypothetical protein CEK27_004640 [Fusarium fujikuroi]QGI77863.1 hypothetical protein CEK25_004592 [Fusarium fujikuroi]QGI91571.1 hypothetical protein CEK26_004640 [Fusarium fujikuroi]VTT59981.1 unnamed protein product [Fusarium fujikuroi]VTT62938.1 unnamed protein product [Fusarium fujikuroi]
MLMISCLVGTLNRKHHLSVARQLHLLFARCNHMSRCSTTPRQAFYMIDWEGYIMNGPYVLRLINYMLVVIHLAYLFQDFPVKAPFAILPVVRPCLMANKPLSPRSARRFSLRSVTFVWISQLYQQALHFMILEALCFVVITRQLGFSDHFINAQTHFLYPMVGLGYNYTH